VLYIKDDEEPGTGEVVRFWYTLPHTLNGLDTETATTHHADDDTLLVTGAAALAALSRSIGKTETANVDGWVPKKLRLWGEARLAEFEAGLAKLASREAAQHSGIAPGPSLDRWDGEETGWY